MPQADLQQFYIPEEQSIYLLSHDDARKLKDWIGLCEKQLERLGYSEIELIGKGAYGFVFGGCARSNARYVFKFSRVNLPQHVQDRLEEEAFMLGQVDLPRVPSLIAYQRIKRQSILVMERARGQDLEQFSLQRGRLSPRQVVRIAVQLAEILRGLRASPQGRPIVHGDIKPSNIVFDPETECIALVDWGSSVFAQLDEHHEFVGSGIMGLMSDELQQTNARLGDVYFIGPEQLNGDLSSPRFDEQGVVGTLYALASGQSCRFGSRAMPPTSLGLPQEFARVLEAMLDENPERRAEAGDYFMRNMPLMARLVVEELNESPEPHLIPIWVHTQEQPVDTVVYSSRKSFLREESCELAERELDDIQFDRYYKNFMQGMGDTEKAFLAAVGRLGRYPVVGGLAVRWEAEGVYIDSSLNLLDEQFSEAFVSAVNNTVTLARAIHRQGIFKSCLFNARDTLHIDRPSPDHPFVAEKGLCIPYVVSEVPELEDESRLHSYFEDGKDPDEFLDLPQEIMSILTRLNGIHHTGMIIFESLPTHLKIHSYYRLLNPARELEFRELLAAILNHLRAIKGLGISGFMKMPYKDIRFFTPIDRLPERFYPKNPRG